MTEQDKAFYDELAEIFGGLMKSGAMKFDENGDMIGHFDIDLTKKPSEVEEEEKD